MSASSVSLVSSLVKKIQTGSVSAAIMAASQSLPILAG
jgi:hypothetical protein